MPYSPYHTLVHYDVGSGLSLRSTVSSLWTHLYGDTELPLDVQPFAMMYLCNLDENSFDMLGDHINGEYLARKKTLSGEDKATQQDKIIAYYDLFSIHRVLAGNEAVLGEDFPLGGTVDIVEEKIGRKLCAAAKQALTRAVDAPREPFSLQAGLDFRAEVSGMRGEFLPQAHVALPLTKLFIQTFNALTPHRCEVIANATSETVPQGKKPDLLLTCNKANIFCCEVKADAGDITMACKEAMGYCLCLTQQTHYSTVVMGVAGDEVRIGLLTLLPSNAPKNHKLPVLSGTFPEELKQGLEAANVTICYHVWYSGQALRLCYVIEFNATKVVSTLFDAIMRKYFSYIMEPICEGQSKSTALEYLKDGRVVHCTTNDDDNLLFPGCSSSFVVKVLEPTHWNGFTEAHIIVGQHLHWCGTITIDSTENMNGDFVVCIYDYMEGMRIRPRRSPGSFAKACALIVHLHGKGYCHGDVRSPNIISKTADDRSFAPEVRLIDFEYLTNLTRVFQSNPKTKTAAAFDEFLKHKCSKKVSSFVRSDVSLHRRLIDIYSLFLYVWYWTPRIMSDRESSTGSPKGGSKSGSPRHANVDSFDPDIYHCLDQDRFEVFQNELLRILSNRIVSSKGILAKLLEALSVTDSDLPVENAIIVTQKLFSSKLSYRDICTFVVNTTMTKQKIDELVVRELTKRKRSDQVTRKPTKRKKIQLTDQ